MTDIDTGIEALEAIVAPKGEELHFTCCHDDLTALCNKVIDNFDPIQPEDYNCKVCDFLATTPFCPRGLTCPETTDDP